MNKPRSTPPSTPTPGDALTVRFVRQMPNEEVVYYARRCAQKAEAHGPLTLVLEAKAHPGRPMHEARIEQAGQVLIAESDPEILLAVRNAFDRLAMESLTIPAHLRAQLRAAAPLDAPKLWS